MKETESRKLVLAKAELKRAMRARDAKRIARATARVAIADPAVTDTIFCSLKLMPFMKLLRGQRFKSLDTRILRAMIRTEFAKVERKYKIQLSPWHKRIATSSFMGILKKFWKQDQRNNK